MSRVIEIRALVIGGLALVRLVGAARALSSAADGPSLAGAPASLGRRRTRHESARRPTPAALDSFSAALLSGCRSAGGVHTTVRPLLREIAGARLAERRVSLDGQPAGARALLGDALWELVRADRPAPVDRRGPGLALADLETFTDRLRSL